MRELQRLHLIMGQWPTSDQVNKLFRKRKTFWGKKPYYRLFRKFSIAMEKAGGPKRRPKPADLIADLLRVRDLHLDDKPRGVTPSYKHIVKHSHYSETPYNRAFGNSADKWVMAAGMKPRRLWSTGRAARLAKAYLQLYKELGDRLPNTKDCETARIDFSGIWVCFHGLQGIRRYLGLPILSTRDFSRGRDGYFYKTSPESQTADILFDLLISDSIIDYVPQYRIQRKRRWRIDFLVTLNDTTEVLLEVDGLGLSRPKGPYNTESEKLVAIKADGRRFHIVSSHSYRPWHGLLYAYQDVKAALQQPAHSGPTSTYFSMVSSRVRVDSKAIDARHVHWLVHRKLIPELDVSANVETAAEAITKFLTTPLLDNTVLNIPELAKEVGMTVGPIHRALREGRVTGTVLLDGRPHFWRSRLPDYRAMLGETITDVRGLLSLRRFAALANVTEATVRLLVRRGRLQPKGRHLEHRGLVAYFDPADADAVQPTGLNTRLTVGVARTSGTSTGASSVARSTRRGIGTRRAA